MYNKQEYVNKTQFKNYFDTYFDAIRNFIFYKCGDTEVASDIAQEVFLKLWEKRDSLEEKSLKALLYKMASDMLISHYRHENVANGFIQNLRTDDEDELQPSDHLHYKELKMRYASALSKMPVGQREAFLMNREDNLKYHEIASRLSVSVKAVEKRISSALSYLRTELGELI